MSLLRTNKEITEIYERHADMLYRVCFAYLKNSSETYDAVSETFLRLIKSAPAFETEAHEKAWLIRVAVNICKNTLRHWWRKVENIEAQKPSTPEPVIDGTLEAVMKLPDKYKAAVYLYYYEGYNSSEISEILRKPKSTIRNHLSEARDILRVKLGDDFS